MRRFLFGLIFVFSFSITGGCGKESVTVSDLSSTGSENDNSNTEVMSTASVPEEPDSTADTGIDTLTELSIKDYMAEYGIKAGTCLSPQMISDTKCSEIILSQFNSITLENAMKPDAIIDKSKSKETGELVVSFGKDTIKLLDWCKAMGMSVRGHTLVWYSQTPNWIFYNDFNLQKGLVDRDEMLKRMESLIKQVFEKLDECGYTEMFYAYDVVNEAIEDNGTLRENNWKKIIGDDYLWWAFYYADKYAPESIDLYYNDFNEQFKYTAIKKQMESLKDENGRSLVDGIGLQAHLYTSDDFLRYLSAIDSLSATGLKIELTELDVCLGAYQKKIDADEDNLNLQGRFYYNLLNGIIERKKAGKLNLDAITFWGVSDNRSWRATQYPLLYNYKFEPKAAYFGVLQMKERAGFGN